MAAANNSTLCLMSPEHFVAQKIIYRLTYNLLPALFFVFGFCGHFIALIAFLKPLKSDSAYGYQILVTLSKLAHIVATGNNILLFYNLARRNWPGVWHNEGAAWFSENYFLMIFASCVSSAIHSTFISMPIFASAMMAIDRAIALLLPFRYKNFSHKRNQSLSGLFCLLISLLFGLEGVFRWSVVPYSGSYAVVANQSYYATLFFAVPMHIRNILRIAAVLIIAFCDGVIIHYYKTLSKNDGISKRGSTKAVVRKRKQQTVLLLALYQSISTGITAVAILIFNFCLFMVPKFRSCVGLTLVFVIDLWMQMIMASEFYVLLFVSSDFRAMVVSVVLNRRKESSDCNLQHEKKMRSESLL